MRVSVSGLCCFFFLMIRQPPRSSLFPSTTLFRSCPAGTPSTYTSWPQQPHSSSVCATQRSEEHTSELQSPDHLVCRLLLAKINDDAGLRSLGRLRPDGGPRRRAAPGRRTWFFFTAARAPKVAPLPPRQPARA